MDLVSNYIGELSSLKSGKKEGGIDSNLDLNDSTFANMLEKQLNKIEDNSNNVEQIGNLGIPAGINIGDFDGNVPQFGIDNGVKPINETESSALKRFDNPKEFSTSEILTFFPSLFDSKPSLTETQNNGLFDFERKLAATSYGQYARNIVTDLTEFVTDTIKSRL